MRRRGKEEEEEEEEEEEKLLGVCNIILCGNPTHAAGVLPG
jgi:hypothetical protein